MLLHSLLMLLLIVLGAIVIVSILAPLEALGWWAGWSRRERYQPAHPAPAANATAGTSASHYVVFLSGIGDASGRWHYPQETEFLAKLQQRLPDAVIIGDLFAYSITTRGVDEQQRMHRMWGRLNELAKKDPLAPAGWLINLRNLFQVAVSADHRYGPFFNLGQAENILDALVAHGYQVGSGQRVVLIGYSGGGQVSLGAASYLAPALQAPILVISVGGVMNSEPGCMKVEHVYHLQGAKDPIHRVGSIMFYGRWPVARTSAWNRARRQGTLTFVTMDEMAHNGATGYFGDTRLADGQTHVERTLDVVVSLIEGQQPTKPVEPAQPVETAPPSKPVAAA